MILVPKETTNWKRAQDEVGRPIRSPFSVVTEVWVVGGMEGTGWIYKRVDEIMAGFGGRINRTC